MPSPSGKDLQREDRAIPGHWEGDLLSGIANSYIATLVERHSRFTILVKVPSKDTATVVDALTKQVRKLPASLRRPLTWDRGHEMAKHKSFTVATKVNVYFCDPQSPWQRGTNENTNGLLRQYFPKKTDLSGYSQADLDKVALRLYQRPRKTLGFDTPPVNFKSALQRPVETAPLLGEFAASGGDFTVCRLRRSTQYLLAVYLAESGSPRYFWDVDLSPARLGRVALVRWWPSRFLRGSIFSTDLHSEITPKFAGNEAD